MSMQAKNPYDPPGADLTSEPVAPKKPPGVWWKSYFFILALMSIASYFIAFKFMRGDRYVKESIEFVLSFVSMVGIGGFIFNKKIFRPRPWRYFFYLYVVYLGGFTIFHLWKSLAASKYEEILISLITFILGIVIGLPAYIALYKSARQTNKQAKD